MKPVEGIIKCRYIPSVNSMYIISRRRKVLSDSTREFKNEAIQCLALGKAKNGKVAETPLVIKLSFFIKKSFWRRDVDNMCKAVIDVLQEYYKFNDSWIVQGSFQKRELIGSKFELVKFQISEWDGNYDDLSIPLETIISKKTGKVRSLGCEG